MKTVVFSVRMSPALAKAATKAAKAAGTNRNAWMVALVEGAVGKHEPMMADYLANEPVERLKARKSKLEKDIEKTCSHPALRTTTVGMVCEYCGMVIS